MKKIFYLAVAVIILLNYSVIFGQVTPTSEQLQAWKEFNRKNDGKFEIVWNKNTGTPKVIMGYDTEKNDLIKSGPLEVALDFFKEAPHSTAQKVQ